MHPESGREAPSFPAAALGSPVQFVPGGRHKQEIQEATNLKIRLLEATAQLPSAGVNIILLGHIAGDQMDLQRALRGTRYIHRW